MKYFFSLFVYYSILIPQTFAISKDDIRKVPEVKGSIKLNGKNTIEWLLAFVQDILITTVLPVVVVGAFLWIAYELFTADGDEGKMKQAWLAVAYSAIAIILILMSYFIISLISGLNFGS